MLIEVLSEIILLDRESAIAELSLLNAHISAKEYRSTIKLLSKPQQAKLITINASEVNRRKLTSYGGFKLGDKVRSDYYPSLAGVELTIVEFLEPFVHCLRPSGTDAPGLLVEDLVLFNWT